MKAARARGLRTWVFSAILIGIVSVIVLATAATILALWPHTDRAGQEQAEVGPTGSIVSARVVSVEETPCFETEPFTGEASATGEVEDPGFGSGPETETVMPGAGEDPSQLSCLLVRAELPIGKQVSFKVESLQSEIITFSEGDRVKLVENPTGPDGEVFYTFYDFPRGAQMIVLAILFVLIVIAVGRWRGGLALVGVGAAILLLVTFILPAILAGKPPVLVATAGAIGIMLVVLYLAHGVSHRTTAALFGSIFGIAFTAVVGFTVTRWLRFTGVGSVEDSALLTAVPGLQMNDVLTATIVIAGLGILNDITVAQASAVWEMRELNPQLPKRRIFRSAMRVGRDHIASSIYTLVFAYAGAMLVVLLLITAYRRDLVELVTSEQIAQEVIRTLIGAAGLVLSMPVTTVFAVLFAKPPAQVSAEGVPVVGAQDPTR